MSRKTKIRVEEKVKFVRRCISGELSVCEAARKAGVNHGTICRWVARYEAEGIEGFLNPEKNRTYSPELKLKAVLEYLSGSGSLLDICKRYKIKKDEQLRNWIRVYNAHAVRPSGMG